MQRSRKGRKVFRLLSFFPQADAEQTLKALPLYLVETLQRLYLARSLFATAAALAPDGGDHCVLARVLGRDELEDLHAVACAFEQERAQRVGHGLGLALKQNPVAQDAAQRFGRAHLRPQLLVTARRGDDDRGSGLDALEYCVVGRRVAGVERDEQVGARQREVLNETGLKLQAVEARAPRYLVAQFDKLGARLDAGNVRADARRVVEVVVDGEGQVTLARAHVND